MKILRLLTVLVIAALTFAACDDTTEGIGGSITNKIDNINISNSAFNVTTKSIVADSVLSRNNTGLIGKMKDPETGNYVKGDYMTQLGLLPTFSVSLYFCSLLFGLSGIVNAKYPKSIRGFMCALNASEWYTKPMHSNISLLVFGSRQKFSIS